jgi:hypothetical protein
MPHTQLPEPLILRRYTDQTPDEHNQEHESIELRLRVGDDRMNNMETLIKENTEVTTGNAELLQEIKEILDLGKTFFKFLSILGKIFKWVASIGAGLGAIVAIYHNLPPPGGK